MNKHLNSVKDILIKNGFIENGNKFSNGLCSVIINEVGDDGFYEVINNEGSMFSSSLSIYWLIGVLIYYNYIDNFKK